VSDIRANHSRWNGNNSASQTKMYGRGGWGGGRLEREQEITVDEVRSGRSKTLACDEINKQIDQRIPDNQRIN
jgi:hypothetical protein